jgi:hypothetical protein
MHYSSETDPPEIRHKLAALHSQEAIVKQLSQSLNQAQIEYERLKMEICAYRTSLTPMQRCPEEVILMIFQAYANNNTSLATHLLPVCRRWHHIIVNAPGLWNHISVRYGGTWDVKAEAGLATRRINTCLKYSASMPLHITLDCQNLESEQSRLSGYIAHCLNEIGFPDLDTSFKTRNVDVYSLGATVLDRDISRCHPDHAIVSISTLVEDIRRQKKRCESLDVILPKNNPRDLRQRVWQLFGRLSLSLVTLSVKESPRSGNSLFDLSSLEVLKLTGDIEHLDFLPLKLNSLKCMVLETTFAMYHRSLQLSRFTQLERLVLRCGQYYGWTSAGTINLPCLRSLHLTSYPSVSVTWNVPVLQLLELDGRLEWPLPDVRVLHVRLENSVFYPKDNAPRLLRQFLSTYKDMQQFTIPARLRSNWDSLVRELTQKQELPLELPNIAFTPA